jgi:phospholipase D1/2
MSLLEKTNDSYSVDVPPFLEEGRNCWRIEKATYAAMITGVGNYYRCLHNSICKAKHSVFIVGWDMDSRIALVRGDDATDDCPSTLYDLIVSKARENPDLQIYLNKWDHSIVFSADREFMPAVRWRKAECPNIHFRFDSVVPIHGSHHQKLIVVDDEVAYCGGIDIGLYRWDTRDHSPFHRHRIDPASKLDKAKDKHYLPNHDIQMCVAGPAAQALGDLVRKRWLMATDYEALPLRSYDSVGIPNTWPESDPPGFKDVTVGVSLTFPPIGEAGPVQQIEKLYPEEIARAEKFIYIENQYLANDRIAAALNQKLKDNPDVRVLVFSSRDPAGLIEESTMWRKRVRFRKILQRGGVEDRAEMVYTLITDGQRTVPLHVHAKIMIVDDKTLHVGSSNLNNRSMMLDSECDLVILGEDEKSCAKIAAIRNDLIREHCGMEVEEIQKLIDHGNPIADFLVDVPHSTQHFRKIRDSISDVAQRLTSFTDLGEPRKPFIPALFKTFSKHDEVVGFPHKKVALGFLAIMTLVMMFLYWNNTFASDFMTAENLKHEIRSFREATWAIPTVIALYVIGGFMFVPVTLMIAVTAATFGPITGMLVSLAGALASAVATFGIGYIIGEGLFKNVANTAFLRITDRVKNAGVVTIAAIRMIPLAPYTLVNMILGVTSVRLIPYMLGTFLGLLPGTIAMVILADSLVHILQNPDPHNLAYVGGGIVLWLAVLVSIHALAGRINHKRSKEYI